MVLLCKLKSAELVVSLTCACRADTQVLLLSTFWQDQSQILSALWKKPTIELGGSNLFVHMRWVVCGASITLKIWSKQTSIFFLYLKKGEGVFIKKDDPAFVVVRSHVDVNLSGNYVELNFLLMCGRKESS
jgi:hypothetical protein